MNKITKKLLEGKLFQKMFRNPFMLMDRSLAPIARNIYMKQTPIENKILFTTSTGNFNCNPKAIANEILKRGLPWELIWVKKKTSQTHAYPQGIDVVLWGSAEFFEAASTSKIWIANSTYLPRQKMYKKANQYQIQTWHGSIGLKRLEATNDQEWIDLTKIDVKNTDFCISNSTFEDDVYKNTFWGDTKILQYGHARNDILLKSEQDEEIVNLKERLRILYKIDPDKKIALYAPTFRNSKLLEAYNLDYEALKEALEKRFGGEWIVLTRLHFTLRKKYRKIGKNLPNFVIDVTNYDDMQDLMVLADVGITDYSSWICDYLLTKKPGFIFATDLADYNTERGFYYPLEELPYPIATTNEQMIDNILNFKSEGFDKKCENFLASKGCIDDGHASERIVDKLEEIMGG